MEEEQSDEQRDKASETDGDEERSDGGAGEVWLLVDHSSTEAALVPVARELEKRGISVELVTITEVIGNVAREAIAGGAERLLRGLRVALRGRTGDEDLVGAIRRRQPDVLVVTEARYARAIGVLENLTGVESLQLGLIADFYVDPNWFNGQLHGFIVAEEQTASDVIARGIPEERVQIAGPALRSEFHRLVDADEARRKLGLDQESRVVLVRASGFDSATLEKLVFQCTLCDEAVRFIFHHDGDGAAAAALRRAADQYGLPAAMFGRVPDLERYFVAADALIAAEDDLYLAEILQCGRPALLIGSGMEQRNGEALAEKGLVEFSDELEQLGTRLDRFLQQESLDKLQTALSDWDGVERHYRLVDALERANDKAVEWRQKRATHEAGETAGEDKKDEFRPSGPFESIGSAADRTSSPERPPGNDEEDSRTTDPARDYASLSRAEAKEQLAQLILKERDCERRLKEVERQQERWRGRLELAREWKEEDLAAEAESILRGYVEDAEPLQQQLRDIESQKAKLRQAARRSSEGSQRGRDGEDTGERASRLEERFRKMEIDSDLEGLKDRIRRELGE